MNDTTRILLVVVGVALLSAVLIPFLVMAGMMGFMGGMMGTMMGNGQCCGGTPWAMGGLAVSILILGSALLVVGLRRQ